MPELFTKVDFIYLIVFIISSFDPGKTAMLFILEDAECIESIIYILLYTGVYYGSDL